MGKLLLFVSLFFWVSATGNKAANEKLLVWQDLSKVESKMKDEPRPIFIEFTAAWCGWCKKMDKTTFQDDAVIQRLNNDFYSVKIDFDNPNKFEFRGNRYTGKEFAKFYGVQGLPTMIVLVAGADQVEKIIGYKTAKQFIKSIKKF